MYDERERERERESERDDIRRLKGYNAWREEEQQILDRFNARPLALTALY
jgi:hypothetical protein